MQTRQARWPWTVVVIAMLAAAAWPFRDNLRDSAEHAAAPAAMPASNPPPAAPAPMPPIQHPIDPGDAADAAIPALADSDAAAWAPLTALAGDEAPLALLLRDHLIQRPATMVDNLPQRCVTARALALKPVPGEFQVSADAAAGADVIAAANAQRYAPYVQACVHADVGAMVSTYRRFCPLFQQAYVELGYPHGHFNDRLVQVIHHLLQTPLPPALPAVVADPARGKYRFVDPVLESLSIGRKALLRMGPEQAEAVRKQLRAIRAALVRS